MKDYKVVNLLSPTLRVIFVGNYNECVDIKNKMGFGYSVSKNYP
jgi:hypothetical protein